MTNERTPLPDGRPEVVAHSNELKNLLAEKQYDTGTHIGWTMLDYPQLKEVLDAVGKTHIAGGDIVGYAYQTTAENQAGIDHRGPMEFSEPIEVGAMLESIADMGMMNEFPNNFKIRMILAVNTDRMLLIDYESDEEPVICDECAPNHLNDQYSCDHGTDVYFSKYSVSVGLKCNDKELDSLLVWF